MPADERTQLADHVVSCAECAAIFQVLSAVDADAKAVGIAVDHRLPLATGELLAAAAAVLLTIGLGVWWAVRTGLMTLIIKPPVSRRRSRHLRLNPAVAPPALWASLPSAPDVRLPADLVLTMRGAGGDREAFLKVFGEAIAPYRAERFADAAPRWRRLPSVTPMSSRCGFIWERRACIAERRLRRLSHCGERRVPQLSEMMRVGWRPSRCSAPDATREARTALQALCSTAGVNRERACAAIGP